MPACRYRRKPRDRRAKQIFGAEHVNVQPPRVASQHGCLSGRAETRRHDPGPRPRPGGHLTHGSKVNFSGIIFRAFSYGVDRQTETIDYAAVRKIAEECRPRMLVVGASAYARTSTSPSSKTLPSVLPICW